MFKSPKKQFSRLKAGFGKIKDYKIKPGVLTNTNAIRILELNGYPREVTNEAFQLAGEFGKNNVTGTKL
jgi:DNA mismatch repair ATPase MutS